MSSWRLATTALGLTTTERFSLVVHMFTPAEAPTRPSSFVETIVLWSEPHSCHPRLGHPPRCMACEPLQAASFPTSFGEAMLEIDNISRVTLGFSGEPGQRQTHTRHQSSDRQNHCISNTNPRVSFNILGILSRHRRTCPS